MELLHIIGYDNCIKIEKYKHEYRYNDVMKELVYMYNRALHELKFRNVVRSIEYMNSLDEEEKNVFLHYNLYYNTLGERPCNCYCIRCWLNGGEFY